MLLFFAFKKKENFKFPFSFLKKIARREAPRRFLLCFWRNWELLGNFEGKNRKNRYFFLSFPWVSPASPANRSKTPLGRSDRSNPPLGAPNLQFPSIFYRRISEKNVKTYYREEHFSDKRRGKSKYIDFSDFNL